MKFNKKFFEKYGYKVTDDPITDAEHKPLAATIERLHQTVSKSGPISSNTIIELEDLVQRYPNILAFKNYLYSAYALTKQKQKAFDYLHETIKKYPNYIFTTLNLIGYYLDEGQLDQAAGLLKEPYDIRNLEKGEFIHQSIFISYYRLATRVEIKRGNINEAKQLHRILFDYDKKHKVVGELADLIIAARGSFFPDMDAPNEREVESISKPIGGQFLSDAEGKPLFNHQEIKQLYEYSLTNIPKNVVESILSLPRPTLIQDLEHVLCDAVLRNLYFQTHDEWADETHNFMIHALYMLTELRAYESLPRILDILRQDTEFCDYWIADWIEDYFNESIYILGENQLDKLKAFVLEENLYPWFRLLATDAVAQVAIKQPERRVEVIAWFKEVIQFHLDNPDNDNFIDSTFLGMFISDLLAARAIELKGEIEQLYAKGWISDFDNGKLSDVLTELETPFEAYDDKPLPNDIFELYNKVFKERRAKYESKVEISDFTKERNDPYEAYMRNLVKDRISKSLANRLDDNDDDYDDDYDWTPQLPIKREEPKVGRNDPCPCGSGKKYKKCHGK